MFTLILIKSKDRRGSKFVVIATAIGRGSLIQRYASVTGGRHNIGGWRGPVSFFEMSLK